MSKLAQLYTSTTRLVQKFNYYNDCYNPLNILMQKVSYHSSSVTAKLKLNMDLSFFKLPVAFSAKVIPPLLYQYKDSQSYSFKDSLTYSSIDSSIHSRAETQSLERGFHPQQKLSESNYQLLLKSTELHKKCVQPETDIVKLNKPEEQENLDKIVKPQDTALVQEKSIAPEPSEPEAGIVKLNDSERQESLDEVKLQETILTEEGLVIPEVIDLLDISSEDLLLSHEIGQTKAASSVEYVILDSSPLTGKYKGIEFKYFPGQYLMTTESGRKLLEHDLQGKKISITPVSEKEFVFTINEENNPVALYYQPVAQVSKFIEASISGNLQKSISTKLIAIGTGTSSLKELGYSNNFNGYDFTFVPGQGLFSSEDGSKYYSDNLKGHIDIFVISNKNFVFIESGSGEKQICQGHSVKQTVNFLELHSDNTIDALQCEIMGTETAIECLTWDM